MMIKLKHKKFFMTLSTFLVLYFTCFLPAVAKDLNTVLNRENVHSKISSRLEKLENKFQKDETAGRLFAQNNHIRIDDRNIVTVYLISASGTTLDETSVRNAGGEFVKNSGTVSKIKVPVHRLKEIADTISGISWIKLPDKPLPVDVQSEGVDLTGALDFHSLEFTGNGINIAVIDVGFAGLSSAVSEGELPEDPNDVVKIDCTGSNCISANFNSDTEKHGTAVAEIIHDMAPDARLFLIKVEDTLDVRSAVTYCINNGIDIINHSLVLQNTNFYDGKCWFANAVCSAEIAYANNILWVNSTGNSATKHYEATFTDTDGDGWHNVSGNNETIDIVANAGENINVFLTWDAWPETDQDYDLALYYDVTLVAESTNRQTGTQEPTEEIFFDVPTTGTYSLAIKKYSASSNHRLDVYSSYHELTPAIASSSLLSPADADEVLAVGAINVNDWTTGPQEPFSSQGPTNDGRIKPDIMGPDHVLNSTEGVFVGTSASCAHVSGAAALILSKNPICSATEVKDALTVSAIDMGTAGKDNIYGYGRLNLDVNRNLECTGAAVGDSGGGGGGCFIATAAYGSYAAPSVLILRKMRDRFLLTNRIGKSFVSLYYKYSPPMADYISNHDNVKIFIRLSLLPLVGISWLALKIGPLFTLSLLALFVFGLTRLISSNAFQKRNKTLVRRPRV